MHYRYAVTTLFICLLSLTPSLYAVSCGDVLVGGTHALTDDLDCTAFAGTAVTLSDGAALDLGGFAVFPGGDMGIELSGEGATLTNGVIAPTFAPVVLGGTGGHLVDGVEVLRTPYIAFWLQSHGNTVQQSYTEGAWIGFQVDGNNNKLLNNESNGSDVIAWVVGTQNTIRGHQGFGDYHGFVISGNNNLITENNVGQVEGEGTGLYAEGAGNLITRNIFGDFLVDAHDASGNCETNFWQNNTFQTADPACLLTGSDSLRAVFKRR